MRATCRSRVTGRLTPLGREQLLDKAALDPLLVAAWGPTAVPHQLSVYLRSVIAETNAIASEVENVPPAAWARTSQTNLTIAATLLSSRLPRRLQYTDRRFRPRSPLRLPAA